MSDTFTEMTVGQWRRSVP